MALIALMTQIGSFVPAERAIVPIFDGTATAAAVDTPTPVTATATAAAAAAATATATLPDKSRDMQVFIRVWEPEMSSVADAVHFWWSYRKWQICWRELLPGACISLLSPLSTLSTLSLSSLLSFPSLSPLSLLSLSSLSLTNW